MMVWKHRAGVQRLALVILLSFILTYILGIFGLGVSAITTVNEENNIFRSQVKVYATYMQDGVKQTIVADNDGYNRQFVTTPTPVNTNIQLWVTVSGVKVFIKNVYVGHNVTATELLHNDGTPIGSKVDFNDDDFALGKTTVNIADIKLGTDKYMTICVEYSDKVGGTSFYKYLTLTTTESGTIEVDNTSYMDDDEAGVIYTSVGRSLNVYVCASKTDLDCAYSVSYSTEDNLVGTKFKDGSKVVKVATGVGKANDDYAHLIISIPVEFDNPGEYVIVVGLARFTMSYYSFKVFHIVVNEEGGIEESSSTFNDDKRIEELNRELQQERSNDIWSILFTACSFFGILVLVYSLMILVAFYVDIFNVFTEGSLLHRLTFNNLYPVENMSDVEHLGGKEDRKHYISHKGIWLSFIVGVCFSAVLLNARSLIIGIIHIYQWFSGLF